MAEAQRVEIGFEGGQVISARITEDELAKLYDQLTGAGGWHDLTIEEGGGITLDLGKVAFVRVGTHSSRVGFGTVD